MAEINLPTKANQDSIKVETDKIQSIKNETASILGKFPIKHGTVFNDVRVSVSGSSGSTHYPNTILSITGKGVLHSIINPNASALDFAIELSPGKIFRVSLARTNSITIMSGFDGLKITCNQINYGEQILYSLG